MKGSQNRRKAKEMVAKAKYMKGCQIGKLAETDDNAKRIKACTLLATEPERLESKFYCFGLSLR